MDYEVAIKLCVTNFYTLITELDNHHGFTSSPKLVFSYLKINFFILQKKFFLSYYKNIAHKTMLIYWIVFLLDLVLFFDFFLILSWSFDLFN